MKEFHENICRKEDGRYEVNVPWVPGAKLTKTNELQCRKRLQNLERKLENKESLKQEYTKILEDQLKDEIIEKVPETATGSRIYYMPHKSVVRDSATTTKARMVFDASVRPDSSSNSINVQRFSNTVTFVGHIDQSKNVTIHTSWRCAKSAFANRNKE